MFKTLDGAARIGESRSDFFFDFADSRIAYSPNLAKSHSRGLSAMFKIRLGRLPVFQFLAAVLVISLQATHLTPATRVSALAGT